MDLLFPLMKIIHYYLIIFTYFCRKSIVAYKIYIYAIFFLQNLFDYLILFCFSVNIEFMLYIYDKMTCRWTWNGSTSSVCQTLVLIFLLQVLIVEDEILFQKRNGLLLWKYTPHTPVVRGYIFRKKWSTFFTKLYPHTPYPPYS